MERSLIRRVESLFQAGARPEQREIQQTIQQLDQLQEP